MRRLHTRAEGLSGREASARLHRHGPNRLQPPSRPKLLRSILRRLANPLVLVLLCASSIPALTGDTVSFVFIAVIVLMSVALDMVQEHRAGNAMEALRRSIALRVRAWRNGQAGEIEASRLVPGDVVELSAGDLVPADGRVQHRESIAYGATRRRCGSMKDHCFQPGIVHATRPHPRSCAI